MTRKWIIGCCAFSLGTVLAMAQAEPWESQGPGNQGNGAMPPRTGEILGRAPTNATAPGGLTFTNSSGTTYSLEQLATQLRNLRAAVDEAMPVISSFNEMYSKGATNSTGSMAGTISGILSQVLKGRNGQQQDNNTGTQGQGDNPRATNLLGVLEGILGTNAPGGTVGLDQNTLRQLVALETQLQPLSSTLDALVVTNSSAFPGQNPQVTPTGRSR